MSFTLHEAAQLLGVSLGTVRRRIARGELRAERVQRPQGHVWQVWLEPAQDAATVPNQPPASALPYSFGSTLPQDAAPVTARATMVAPLIEQALRPLVAELADTRQQLVQQAEELGRFKSDLQQAQTELMLARDQLRQAPAPEGRSDAPERPTAVPTPDMTHRRLRHRMRLLRCLSARSGHGGGSGKRI